MNTPYLNNPVDIAEDFLSTEHNYFFLTELRQFDRTFQTGTIWCRRYRRKLRFSFNQEMLPFEETQGWEFPPDYRNDKELFFTLSFISETAIRIQLDANKTGQPREHQVPLIVEESEKLRGTGNGWILTDEDEEGLTYRSRRATLRIGKKPFKLTFCDEGGKRIWETYGMDEKTSLLNSDPLPCCFIQKAGSGERRFAFSYTLKEDEKFYGCGESFTRLNKRGQRVILYTHDPKGVETSGMYKPVPFYLSSAGYGLFMHGSCPMTFDFGAAYGGAQSLFVGESYFDMVLFIGSPREVLSEYSSLTGRSPMVPAWSFGLWMGRITYASQEEVLETAEKLRRYRIPCDVIHLDTGWFSQDWRCDFVFDPQRFPDPALMLKTLHNMNFHLSLWQLPYSTPQNSLFAEALAKGYAIKGTDDDPPTEDAIYDFSNPEAAAWYQGLLERVLTLGVDVIKADFGEAAPDHGRYHNGRDGRLEHNLYPLRYNKTVSEVTRKIKGYSLIWGRSAWAGSQRYPVHWGGDAESTSSGMAATLRGGLSLGLSGFTFWSHDIGGFVKPPPPDLYLRWLAFGMFSSHPRCHGNPPREPWDFSENFMEEFRKLVRWRYSLMPYILAQACQSARNGYPMIRPLFFEFPQDKTAWYIENEYLFGDHLLVAPLFEDGMDSRDVYLPGNDLWLDYHSRKAYSGGTWQTLAAPYHIVALVKDGSIIPTIEPKDSLAELPETPPRLQVYRNRTPVLSGLIPRFPWKEEIEPLSFRGDNNRDKNYTLSPDGRELLRKPKPPPAPMSPTAST
jgi:alpha-D-xyloside xylohydrolase